MYMRNYKPVSGIKINFLDTTCIKKIYDFSFKKNKYRYIHTYFFSSSSREVMDVPYFDRTIGKAISFKRNIPIKSDSTSKWTYYGLRNKKSVYGKIHFTATIAGNVNQTVFKLQS